MKKLFTFVVVAFSLFACSQTETNKEQVATLRSRSRWRRRKDSSPPLPVLAESKDNPLTPSEGGVRKSLFYDTRLRKTARTVATVVTTLRISVLTGKPPPKVMPGNRETAIRLPFQNAAFHLTQFGTGARRMWRNRPAGQSSTRRKWPVPTEAFLVKRLRRFLNTVSCLRKRFPKIDNRSVMRISVGRSPLLNAP